MNIKKWKHEFVSTLINNKVVKIYSDGTIYNISYVDINKKLHNISGPAYISWYANDNKIEENFYSNGERNNFILPNDKKTIPSFRIWYENGNIKNEQYYINNKLCNFTCADGKVIPAFTVWCIDGKKNTRRVLGT